MTDEFGPLRQAMSDLAEHGGNTDLYERSLRTSRKLQRRTALVVGSAGVAVVFAIGGAVAVATANRPGPPTPAATQPAAPSTAPTSAPSVAPTSAAPSTTPPSSVPPTSSRTSNRPRYPDCPSAKTLEKLADLPKDWRFVPSSVECWKDWATAAPEGPNLGDGIYLFRYKAGTGWRFHSEGSGFICQELGITSGNPPFCQMD
ncbi:hypothetical protein [Actinoplanes aureus]|uniref:Uncharacterized protein n=1 Tax=Actinoplanes aureus TaxID=2792083 RepID=A0A931CI72_9ACTN|nr:hypothetical protein [Actinoplanes aureus]MBG0566628.1 hypothetical protein [Actinoplanes aureus]